MSIRVGINGFGRIGRNLFRACLGEKRIEIVAINDVASVAALAHLLKHDSILGALDHEVKSGPDWLEVDGTRVPVWSQREPAQVDWAQVGADVVAECSGKFNDATTAAQHLRGSVRKVVISAPANNADVTVVLGVNEGTYDADRHKIISNASCTTNCLAPVAKVVHDRFGIVSGFMTTVHSYTNDQRVLDQPHKDLRRARAAAVNMIPTSTGAAKALHLVIPELKGRLDGFALRVPTPDVSLVDLNVTVQRATSVAEVNGALREAAEGPMRGILGVESEPLVSSDFRGDARSAIVDAALTNVIGSSVKVVAWYDNEWGYSCRLRDLLLILHERGL